MLKRYGKALLSLGAPPTWTASLVPMAVGYGAAFIYGGAALGREAVFWIFISIVAMIFIETGKHGVNELKDYFTGNDAAVDADHMTPYSGGKKVLVPGLVTPKAVVAISALCFMAAGLLGMAIVFFQSFHVLWFGMAGVAISIFYSMPPFQLVYRGLGELAVGITYGPLIVCGAYTVFATGNRVILLAMSLHLSCLIVNVLVINEFPDYEADLQAGKLNLLARVGKTRGVLWHRGLFVASYLPIITLMVYTGHPAWLLSLLLIPMMWKSNRTCALFPDDIPGLMEANKLTILIHLLGGLALFIAMLIHGA
ncbi:MAG: prenyltransferase [Anaerovoracaceae bacterium]|jgi:1,4-dihydroxy-2-naphthoate octaprenyltransferase